MNCSKVLAGIYALNAGLIPHLHLLLWKWFLEFLPSHAINGK